MAGQYEDAFSPPRMQCWTVPRPPAKLPTPRPPTAFIADDRGHLLPHVPRSQVSPWGTFLGTWDLPAPIPPARLDLSAREPRAATRELRGQPRVLREASNGIVTCVTGKLQEPWDTEPSGNHPGGLSRGSPRPEAPTPGDKPGGGPCPLDPPCSGCPCPLSPPGSGCPCPQSPLGSGGPQTPPGSGGPQSPRGSGGPQSPPGSGCPQSPRGAGGPLNPPGLGCPQSPPGLGCPQSPRGSGCPQSPPGSGGPQSPPGLGCPQTPPGSGCRCPLSPPSP